MMRPSKICVEAFTVVRQEDDQGRGQQFPSLECSQKPAEPSIQVLDFPLV
jgi:hypothetical protein